MLREANKPNSVSTKRRSGTRANKKSKASSDDLPSKSLAPISPQTLRASCQEVNPPSFQTVERWFVVGGILFVITPTDSYDCFNFLRAEMKSESASRANKITPSEGSWHRCGMNFSPNANILSFHGRRNTVATQCGT